MSSDQDGYPYQHIFERDKFTCQYCGWKGNASFESWYIAGLSVDHIVPKLAGGTENDSNLVVSCRPCLEHKGNLVPESFEHARRQIDQKRAGARTWFDKHVREEKS